MEIESFFCTEKFLKNYRFIEDSKPQIYKKPQQLPSNSLLLGINTEHHLAYHLSDLPLIVFDQHTDMYDSYMELGMHSGNWICWALKNRPEIHLVMPNFEELDLKNSIIPKGYVHKLSIYCFNGPSEIVRDDFKIRTKSIKLLCKELEGKRKQISIDFDFLEIPTVGTHRSVKIMSKIIEKIIRKRDFFDFWFNRRDSPELNEKDVKTLLVLLKSINKI